MRTYQFSLGLLLVTLTGWTLTGAIEWPSSDALGRLGICKKGHIRLCADYEGIPGVQYSFLIFEVTCPDAVHYVFWSAVAQDAVAYRFSSDSKVLEFFSLRFRGIANDLKHGKPRNDVRNSAAAGDARHAIILALVYSGYANAVEETRQKLFVRPKLGTDEKEPKRGN
jgi:hypothetical protein